MNYRIILMACIVTFISAFNMKYSDAFCGFHISSAQSDLYNDAAQVVLMHHDNQTVMTLSNHYRGPAKDFAMIIPVPKGIKVDQIKTLSPKLMRRIDEFSAPRLIEFWERDPCDLSPSLIDKDSGLEALTKEATLDTKGSASSVKVEAQFITGEYQFVLLEAKEATSLEIWLKEKKYHLPQGIAGALEPYIKAKMNFLVAQVDIKKLKLDKQGVAKLSPIRIAYPSSKLSLPVRLGMLNSSGTQDLIIYVLSPSRYEVVNRPKTFIPSNLEVVNQVRTQFGAFYMTLFEAVLKHNKPDTVVTEFAWQILNCEHCSREELTYEDLLTLGGDLFVNQAVIPSTPSQSQPNSNVSVIAKDGDSPTQKDQVAMIATGDDETPSTPQAKKTPHLLSWVLTRMHLRYGKDSPKTDLIFTQAGPVAGGRAPVNDQVDLPGAVVKSDLNQFQARYVLRHQWPAKISCESPILERWDGAPYEAQSSDDQTSMIARDIGNLKSLDQPLNDLVNSSLSQLNIKGKNINKRKIVNNKDKRKKTLKSKEINKDLKSPENSNKKATKRGQLTKRKDPKKTSSVKATKDPKKTSSVKATKDPKKTSGVKATKEAENQ